MNRRSFLATIGIVATAGCTLRADNGGLDDPDYSADLSYEHEAGWELIRSITVQQEVRDIGSFVLYRDIDAVLKLRVPNPGEHWPSQVGMIHEDTGDFVFSWRVSAGDTVISESIQERDPENLRSGPHRIVAIDSDRRVIETGRVVVPATLVPGEWVIEDD